MGRSLLLLLIASTATGCIRVKVDPIDVRATVDVNVRVDRALNDFFGDLDRRSTTIAAPAPQP